MTGVGQGRGNFISFLADVFRLNSPTIFTSVFTRLPRAKKKLLESLLLRSGVVSLWELLVRKSVIKGKKFYSCGLFAFYHGTNFRILFPRHSKVNKDWMRVRRVVISSFPMFICFFKDFYSTVRSMYIATFKESLKIKYFF